MKTAKGARLILVSIAGKEVAKLNVTSPAGKHTHNRHLRQCVLHHLMLVPMTLHCECPCCYFVPICSLSLCTEQPVWIDSARHGCHLPGNQKYRWTQGTDAGHQERLARNTSIKAVSNHCPVYSHSSKIVS